MIVDRSTLNTIVKNLVGDRTDDEALEMVQNISDTLDDFESKASVNIDHEKELKELEEKWRTKYRDTFFGKPSTDPTGDSVEDGEEKPKKYTYENLFKESEV